jgi:starch synthase
MGRDADITDPDQTARTKGAANVDGASNVHESIDMRVLFATSEAYPLAKTGGLADVSHALPKALARRGVDIRLLLPGYPGALARIENPRIVSKIGPLLGVTDAKLVSGRAPESDLPVFLVDAPSLFRREGGLYQRDDEQDWPDNALRFAFFSHVAAAVAMGRTELGWAPDMVHANDWHTGLLPLLLAFEEAAGKPRSVFTTHNAAFQGNFPADIIPTIGVPERSFSEGHVEFYGQVSFLKAGLRFADRVTTVSPTYASEILTPEFGLGMDGLLRARGADFCGILNGIDDDSWDPSQDIHVTQPFHANDISGKRLCKTSLQREFGLPLNPGAPLFGFVSRITHQKMADVILAALPGLAERGAQFVLVGEGDSALESGFRDAQAQYPDRVSVHIGYDEARAHRLHAGADVLLAPARFEPCGLTQLYAMRYGTPPIVRRTGGLADTVIDASPDAIADRTASGFVFEDPSLEGLLAAVDRALKLYSQPLIWRRLQLQAMAQDFSWNASAGEYISLYSDLSGMSAPAYVASAASDRAAEHMTQEVVKQRAVGRSYPRFENRGNGADRSVEREITV